MKISGRAVFVSLGFIALLVIGLTNWDKLTSAWSLTESASWQILILLPLLQAASFLAYACFYHSGYAIFDYHTRLANLYKLTLGVNFVNQAAPSFGVSAVSFMYYGLKRSIPSGKIALVQYGKYILGWLSYIPLIVSGVSLAYLSGDVRATSAHILVAALVASLVFIAGILYFTTNRRRFNSLIYFGQRLVNRIGKLLRRKRPLVDKPRIRRLLKEFHAGFALVRHDKHKLILPAAWMLLMAILELSVLYCVFVALGYTLNPGIIVIGHTVANGASLFSVIPGDVGVFEVAMVAAFNGVGVPVDVAISATLIFRVVNKLLFLPVGFYFYSRVLGSKQQLETAPSVR